MVFNATFNNISIISWWSVLLLAYYCKLCLLILYWYKWFTKIIVSSVLWCLLRFPHKTMFGSSLPAVVCRRTHVLFTYSGVRHIMCCVVFLFCFSSSSSCQFHWIVHFWLPLQYSLTFIS